MKGIRTRFAALVVLVGMQLNPAFAQAVSPAEAQSAFLLYKQQKYALAADAFEGLLRRQPTASYCYYAALAHRSSHKELRARQLFEYVVANFPTSQEAAFAKTALAQGGHTSGTTTGATGAHAGSAGSAGNSSAVAAGDDLPESVKALLPPDMAKMLDTPMGRQAVMQVMKEQGTQVATIRQAEKKGLINQTKLAAAVESQGIMTSRVDSTKQFPFSPQDIAKDGAAAIDQTRYPNCWFEASMAALAELPRGQRLISTMIRGKGSGTYVVRFPGDGNEYTITSMDLQKADVHNSALWASLIEAAQTRKFPDNEGAEGPEGDLSRLQVGLSCISGYKAEVIMPSKCSKEELSSFIGSAVKSQNPVVCGTFGSFGNLPEIVFTRHAYTIIGFDPASNMITLRNPHGRKSKRFALGNDPHHEKFEQLEGGLFKMNANIFPLYFHSVCRSFI